MIQKGIYTITNIINNKIYIGESTNLKIRLRDHLNTLRRGKHKNIHLQNSFNKYKESNFKFEILEECDEDILKSQENYWCNMLNTHNRKYGYNIDPTSPIGSTRNSKESIEKMKLAQRKKYNNGYINPRKGKSCSDEHKRKIGLANSNKTWSDEHRIKVKIIFNTSVKRKEANKIFCKNKLGTGKKIFKYNLNKNYITEYISINETIRKENISRKSIYNCCTNKTKSCKGFIYSFIKL